MTNLVRPEPVVVLTDYDLDGACASIVLDHAFNVAARKQQNLRKVQENMEYLCEKYTNINTIVFADVCIDPETMRWALEHYDHVVYYDHHEGSAKYEELASIIPEKLTVYFDLKLCSAALVYKSFIVDAENYRTPQLDALINGVSAFDLWKPESKHFPLGKNLNDMFWEYQMDTFRKRFVDGWDGFTTEEEKVCETKDKVRDETLERALRIDIGTGGKIIGIENPEAINFVTTYFSEGDIFYILYPNFSTKRIHLSVRCATKDPKINLDMAMQELIGSGGLTDAIVVRGGGHAHAIGVQFKEAVTPDVMCEWIKKCLDVRVRNW